MKRREGEDGEEEGRKEGKRREGEEGEEEGKEGEVGTVTVCTQKV